MRNKSFRFGFRSRRCFGAPPGAGVRAQRGAALGGGVGFDGGSGRLRPKCLAFPPIALRAHHSYTENTRQRTNVPARVPAPTAAFVFRSWGALLCALVA